MITRLFWPRILGAIFIGLMPFAAFAEMSYGSLGMNYTHHSADDSDARQRQGRLDGAADWRFDRWTVGLEAEVQESRFIAAQDVFEAADDLYSMDVSVGYEGLGPLSLGAVYNMISFDGEAPEKFMEAYLAGRWDQFGAVLTHRYDLTDEEPLRTYLDVVVPASDIVTLYGGADYLHSEDELSAHLSGEFDLAPGVIYASATTTNSGVSDWGVAGGYPISEQVTGFAHAVSGEAMDLYGLVAEYEMSDTLSVLATLQRMNFEDSSDFTRVALELRFENAISPSFKRELASQKDWLSRRTFLDF